MSKDKDNESEEKIGKSSKSEPMTVCNLLVFSLRGGSGRVRSPDGDRLHPPDPRHHALLPRVRGQGGAGEDTLYRSGILNLN